MRWDGGTADGCEDGGGTSRQNSWIRFCHHLSPEQEIHLAFTESRLRACVLLSANMGELANYVVVLDCGGCWKAVFAL